MGPWEFELNDPVAITCSGESGRVVGRAQFANARNEYYVRYKAADGRATQEWWTASALEHLQK